MFDMQIIVVLLPIVIVDGWLPLLQADGNCKIPPD
jgi:hypothetical protein